MEILLYLTAAAVGIVLWIVVTEVLERVLDKKEDNVILYPELKKPQERCIRIKIIIHNTDNPVLLQSFCGKKMGLTL